MENKEKYLRTNKRLKIGIIVFSILSVVMLVGNKSYALFSNTIKTNNPVVTINTASEFPAKESPLAEYLLNKAYSNTSELVAIDVTDKNNIKKCTSIDACKGKEIEYRYIGPTVNNYVYLKSYTNANETWRIIGLFKNDEGTEWNIKIVREEVLPDTYLPTNYIINDAVIDGKTKKVTYTIKGSEYKAYWNKNDSRTQLNRWEEAGLQYFLNTDHDDSSSSERGYLSRLSPETKALLVSKTYTLGSVKAYPYPNATPMEAYAQERDVASCAGEKGPSGNYNQNTVEASTGCHVWTGNAIKWQGTVALMYPSDYGLSATEANWTTPMYGGSSADGFEDTKINETTWMFNSNSTMEAKSKTSWFLSPSSYGCGYATNWNTTGYMYSDDVYHYYGVRPVLFLSSAATRIDGEGTSSSPYVILEETKN